ncbi:hypothetical protein TRFO_26091 [Tritrichomonas foetus]|uniref:Uncharacterized protein n=1 Tax=Tritrichomonas foetus TaxID=1144522 RepID=A0A1J4K8C1_9EUKA|nr:hypothetical protein TRFO_26091 [Tritrichomonas foetus]|eukprot:OHT05956.1 hypothetical protein TRFO_26091 [Tritrichomonas foetus]
MNEYSYDYDDNGNKIGKHRKHRKHKRDISNIEEEELNEYSYDYDDNGNKIGKHLKEIPKSDNPKEEAPPQLKIVINKGRPPTILPRQSKQGPKKDFNSPKSGKSEKTPSKGSKTRKMRNSLNLSAPISSSNKNLLSEKPNQLKKRHSISMKMKILPRTPPGAKIKRISSSNFSSEDQSNVPSPTPLNYNNRNLYSSYDDFDDCSSSNSSFSFVIPNHIRKRLSLSPIRNNPSLEDRVNMPIEKRIGKMLSFYQCGGGSFETIFKKMEEDDKKELRNLAEVQTHQKRKWIKSIWELYDPHFNEAAFFETLNAISNDNGSILNGLLKSAHSTLLSFVKYDGMAFTSNLHTVIVGPRFSGKTTFLRSVFLDTLVFLVNTGSFKSTFVIPFDSRANPNWMDSIENIYLFISSIVIDSLIVQRVDLELFRHSLPNSFKNLLTVNEVKKLPKPISAQDYLRRPMNAVDNLLKNLFALYHSNEKAQFLKEVCNLPSTIGSIFEFDSSLIIFDHLDLCNVKINDVSFLPLLVDSISRNQFLVSVEDTYEFEKIISVNKDNWWRFQKVSVTDTCASQYSDTEIEVVFEEGPTNSNNIHITADSCGGCPTFVSRFDSIVKGFHKLNQITSPIKHNEKAVTLTAKIGTLIDLLTSFFDQQGNKEEIPQIKTVFISEEK